MTERKTDVLNLRLDPTLAKEIERIGEWRGKNLSDVARELLTYGVAVERQLEASELQWHYTSGLQRADDRVEVRIDARLHVLSYRELADRQSETDEEMSYAEEYRP
jgi:hypothetical protein